MKKFSKYLLLLTSIGLLSSCVLTPGKKTSSDSSGSSSQPSDTSDTSSKEISGSCIFHTYGSYLPFESFGIHISDEASGYKYRDQLRDAINKEVGATVVSSLNASNCTILTDNGENDQNHFFLAIGTGSSSGELKFNFAKIINKVKITVRPYYKVGYSIDTDATVCIDDDEHKIANDGTNQKQASQTYEKEYSDSTSSVKLHNEDEKQRFYLESVEVFFN